MFRLTIVLLVAICGLALANELPKLPAQFSSWQGRIVGGSNAVLGQFPYQVSLRTAGNFHFCGAAIVNSRWVVSAAHCTVGITAPNIRVVVGVLAIGGGTLHIGSQIINHPNYNPNTIANDVSVVQTINVLPIGPNVAPVPLPANTMQTGSGIVSGWGQTSHPGAAAQQLQFVNKQIITNDDCRSRHNIINRQLIFESTICTVSPVGVGTCMGDSGGPLVAGGQLVGIVSWGIPCGTAAPDAFARVSSFRTWILGHTG